MNEKLVRKWFKSNFRVHTDWAGDWVEYDNHCSSVDELAEEFINFMKEHE